MITMQRPSDKRPRTSSGPRRLSTRAGHAAANGSQAVGPRRIVDHQVSDSKMASVQKLLERLETKGCVCRDRRERAHRFGALISREDFLRHRLTALADRLCDAQSCRT